MPDVPSPITSPPNVPGQPYDASESGPADGSQSTPTHVYDAAGGSGSGSPWVKVQDGGACDMSGRVTGVWPTDGTSDGSAWSQT